VTLLFPDPNSKTWFAEYYRCQAIREDLLKLCATRSISLSEQDKTRIETCESSDQLRKWLIKAGTAHTADEIFAEQSAAPQ